MAGNSKKPIQISFADLCGVPPPPPPGGNSAPVISSGFAPVRLKEISDRAAGENAVYHSRAATLKFADGNAADVHSASFVPLGGGYRGTFSLGNVDQAANCVKWTFKIRDDKLDNLQKGQTLTQTYKITISDGQGGTTSKTITVVLVGTNDAPVITSGVQKATITELESCDEQENNFEHTGNGTVRFADADTLDTHTRTFAPQGGDYIGTFALGEVNQAANSISWTFTVDDSVLEGLAEGEPRVQRYDVTIDDGHGGTATQTVTVCIVGTNDKPVIAIDHGNPDGNNDLVYEAALSTGSNETSTGEFAGGTFTLSDPDGLDDLVSLTINGTTVLIADLILGPASFPGTYGVLTVTAYDPATGLATYIYELTSPYTSNPAADDGNNVEPAADTFTLTVFDGTAASAPATIRIDIVDDVPQAGDNPALYICSPEDDDDEEHDHDHDDDDDSEDDHYGGHSENGHSYTSLVDIDSSEDDDEDESGSEMVVLSGVLAHEFGADQAGSIALTGVDLPADGGFTQSGNGTAILVQQNGIDVLLFELTDSETGHYRVTQLAELCHDEEEEDDDDDEYGEYRESADSNHSKDSSDDEDVIFSLQYSVVDGDGDVAQGSLSVSVCCEKDDAETSDISDMDDSGYAYTGIAVAVAPISYDDDPQQCSEGCQPIDLAAIFGSECLDHGQCLPDSSSIPAYCVQPAEVDYIV